MQIKEENALVLLCSVCVEQVLPSAVWWSWSTLMLKAILFLPNHYYIPPPLHQLHNLCTCMLKRARGPGQIPVRLQMEQN